MAFSIQARGEFVAVLRLRKGIDQHEVAQFLKTTVENVEQIEKGQLRQSDGEFFRLAAYLGAANEVSVLIEKTEKAIVPGLRRARREFAKSSWIHGYTFADETRHETPE